MKTDMKGVSPVIATILLIALTVAAVGIVAAILSGLGTPSITPSATLTLRGTYYPRYTALENTSVQIIHDGGATVRQQDVKVVFKAKVGGRDNAGAYEVKGTIDGFGASAAAPPITWDSAYDATKGTVTVAYNPGNLVAGTTWEVVFCHGPSASMGLNVVVDVLEFTIVYKPTNGILFQNLTISAPTVLA